MATSSCEHPTFVNKQYTGKQQGNAYRWLCSYDIPTWYQSVRKYNVHLYSTFNTKNTWYLGTFGTHQEIYKHARMIRQPIIFDRFEWLILLHYIYSRYFWTDLSGLSYSKLRKPRENVGRACSAYIFHVILLYLGIYHIFPPIFIRVITFTFQVKTDQLGGGYCNPSRLLNKPSHVCRRAAIEKLSYSWNSQLSVGRSVGRSIVSQSVRRSVGRSMGWSVGRSVGRSVASAVSKGIRIFWSLVN